MSPYFTPAALASRRLFMSGLGKATLSATAVGLVVGCESMASQDKMAANPAADTDILNIALGLEHQAIGAYQLGAESGLLQSDVLAVAVTFQGHHKGHRDALARAIGKLGGTPVDTKSTAEYAKALNAGSLKNQTDVLAFAAGLELDAVNGYLGVIPSFSDGRFAKVAGRLAADECMHWTVLSQALGKTLPKEALTFGA